MVINSLSRDRAADPGEGISFIKCIKISCTPHTSCAKTTVVPVLSAVECTVLHTNSYSTHEYILPVSGSS